MRLVWSDESLRDLRDIFERAPVQARRIHLLTEGLRDAPFPGMYRRVPERPGEHVLSVPPYAVFYAIDGDIVTISTIIDARRRREPW